MFCCCIPFGRNNCDQQYRKTQNKRNNTFSDSISGSLLSILSDNGKESESLNISDSVSRPETESVDDSKDYVSKRIKRILRLPILLRIVCLVLLSVYIYFNRDTKAIPVAALAGLVFCAIIVPVIRLFSKVSLSYQMDPDQENEWEDFCSALSILNDSEHGWCLSHDIILIFPDSKSSFLCEYYSARNLLS